MARNRSGPDKEKLAAFRRRALDLGLELKPASFEIGDHTDIGLLAIIFAVEVVGAPMADIREIDDEDNEQIRAVIQGFESLQPAEYGFGFQEFAHDPYLLLGAGTIGLVESSRYEQFSEFELRKRSHPVQEPRDVNIEDLRIVHLGGMRAVATYVFEEHLANEVLHRSNGFAILARLESGWRILVACDHYCSEEGEGKGA